MVDVIRLDSEEAAWLALDAIINNKVNAKNVVLDLSSVNWASVAVKFRGEQFNQTVTASVMRGLIELQDNIYRSISRIIRDDGRITRLTDEEKRQFELVFKVDQGSSSLFADAMGLIKALGKPLEKLNSKQSLIAIIVLLILSFGTAGGYLYLSHVRSMQEVEAKTKGREIDLQEKRELYDFIEKMIKQRGAQATTMRRAAAASKAAADVIAFNDHAVDELLRRSGEASVVEYQGLSIPAEIISAITTSTRARSERIVIKQAFTVTAVEADIASAYKVHLTSVDGSLNVIAELEDPLAGEKYQKAIQRAEWSQTPVFVHLVGKRVGDTIREAKITKAFKPRTSQG